MHLPAMRHAGVFAAGRGHEDAWRLSAGRPIHELTSIGHKHDG